LNGVALESGNPLLERVLGAQDPAVRLQMARWLTLPSRDPDCQRQLLGRLLDDPSVAVRRIALGWCATRQPNNHLPSVRAALLDQSSIIRSIAQFLIPKLEQIDLRRFYREAVCHAERQHLKAALGGLGEIGQPGDADLVVTFIDAPEAKIRKAALGALANLALEAHFEVFINALQSESPGISRRARMALDRHASHIGSERLEMIFAETPHSHVRRQTLSLINGLPKWQKLPILIEIFGSAEPSTRKIAENFLRSWLWTYNKTHHVQPTKPEVARLRQAVAAEGSKFEGRLGTDLRALLQSLH
jgi:HEAT repeat protein